MRLFYFLWLLLISVSITAQERPKLVVGIVIDQMSQDYINRFSEQFSAGGFNRIINKGYSFQNAHYNYVPTYTAPGHASIYTGTTPALHGIISNVWFDKKSKKEMYCTDDLSVKTLGAENESGFMSPSNLLASTITDELKLATQLKSKIYGVSLKDRGAILPAGHSANGAFWFDGKSGNWVSSTYYFEQLPDWANAINEGKTVQKFLTQSWNLLLPLEQYKLASPDENPYEGTFKGIEKSVFPYDLNKIKSNYTDIEFIKSTPFGNTMVTDFAIEILTKEKLGKSENTDFLAISYSSPDYIGHKFGPQSLELYDCYLRLDLELKRLLEKLDAEVGKNNYTLFLTSDHAVAQVPSYMKKIKIPAGLIDETALLEEAKSFMGKAYGNKDYILNFSNNQFFLDQELIFKQQLKYDEVCDKLAFFLRQNYNIAQVYTRKEVTTGSMNDGIFSLIQKGFHQSLSGDVIVNFHPGWIEHEETGTTHGSPYNYDTHVPILFYGKNIPKGHSYRKVAITDIAPTLSMMLHIPLPNASTGNPLTEILK